jgi:hypothetical protein
VLEVAERTGTEPELAAAMLAGAAMLKVNGRGRSAGRRGLVRLHHNFDQSQALAGIGVL